MLTNSTNLFTLIVEELHSTSLLFWVFRVSTDKTLRAHFSLINSGCAQIVEIRIQPKCIYRFHADTAIRTANSTIIMDKVVRIECTVKATSELNAKSIFRLASSRLLRVQDWPLLTDCLLSSTEHRDLHGSPVSRPVKTDDYINLTNEAARPFGWMQVVYVAKSEEENDGEVAVLTRSVGLPFDAENENHFETKPTVLRVVRRGLDVTAGFVMESNPLTTVFERLGVYGVQWRSLVNGILSDLTPVSEQPLSESLRPESRFA